VLAAALRRRAAGRPIEIVNLGQALDRVPVEWEAEIVEGSSWSCAHGVERWRSDCGCQAGAAPGWHQRWRAPLLAALEALRDRLAELYERELAPLVPDPWAARDRFVEVALDPARAGAAELLRRVAGRPLERDETVKALRLLELQRQALLMFTSCGWFFAELSGIETVQVMKYAARAIQLARDAAGVDLEPEFVAALAAAPSNLPELGDGRRVYERLVRPSVATLERVAAHLAIAATVHDVPEDGSAFCYRYHADGRREAQSGLAAVGVERLRIEGVPTRETADLLCCVLRLGEVDFRCGVVPWPGPEGLEAVERALFSAAEERSFAALLRAVDRAFPGRDYTLQALFLDERRRVAAALLDRTLRRYEDDYLEIFEDNLRLMELLREIDSPVPGPLRVAAEVTLSARLRDVTRRTRAGEVRIEAAEPAITAIVELATRLGARLHLAPVRRDVEEVVLAHVEEIQRGGDASASVAGLLRLLALAQRLGLGVDLWDAQNRLWLWAGSSAVRLGPDVVADLARQLWFDPGAFLRRAGLAARPS
jgi:hypothetical protein